MYVQYQSLNSLANYSDYLITIDQPEGRKEGGNDVWYNELSSIHRMRRPPGGLGTFLTFAEVFVRIVGCGATSFVI